MDNKKEERPTRFPQEMPGDNRKTYDHGVIEDVVKHEIEPTSATNPAKPADTDYLNTEFAKSRGDFKFGQRSQHHSRVLRFFVD